MRDVQSSNVNGIDIGYDYDALNRLQTVYDYGSQEPPLEHSYSYDKVGNLESLTYANGITHTWQYNSLNRLTNLNLANGFGALNSYTYTLSAAGMRTRMTETSGRVVNYEYDNLYRLKSESIAGDPYNINGTTTYTYDLVGNRTTRTTTIQSVPSAQSAVYTYSPNDWLTTDTYDDNGNTLGTQLSGAATDTYDWKNRLIRRTTAEGRMIDITYNAMGDRVTKSTGISTVHYLVDRNNLTGYAQVVEELNSSLTVERAYIYGLDLIAQSQLMPREDPAEWQISYYLYDGLGTVRGLADATGLVTDAYFYDAYGVFLNVIGQTPNVYLYTGEQYDPDLGLYFLRARYLNPNTGRFHTMDTFEGVRTDPQSLHKYLYAHGNPVMGVDPSGHVTLAEIAIVGTIVGFAFSIIAPSLHALDSDEADDFWDKFSLCFNTNGIVPAPKNPPGELARLLTGGGAVITLLKIVSAVEKLALGWATTLEAQVAVAATEGAATVGVTIAQSLALFGAGYYGAYAVRCAFWAW